jgi:hypothetical protein
VTVAVWVMATLLMVAETLLEAATVELSVPVTTPLALVVPTGWVSVLPVPVATRTTVAPAIGLPAASFAVTVMVLVPLVAVIVVGEAKTVDCAAETVPGVTVTLGAAVVTEFPLITAWTWLAVPATTPVRVPV